MKLDELLEKPQNPSAQKEPTLAQYQELVHTLRQPNTQLQQEKIQLGILNWVIRFENRLAFGQYPFFTTSLVVFLSHSDVLPNWNYPCFCAFPKTVSNLGKSPKTSSFLGKTPKTQKRES